MKNNFIEIQISYHNLESFIIRKEIFKAIKNAIFQFKVKVLDHGY